MKHILILEDDYDLGFSWQEGLEAQGYAVSLTLNATEAIEAFDNGTVDVFITDMLIKKSTGDGIEPKGGLSTISHRKLSLLQTPYVIACSGSHPALNMLEHALAFGADRAFLKPVDVPQLVATVEELVG